MIITPLHSAWKFTLLLGIFCTAQTTNVDKGLHEDVEHRAHLLSSVKPEWWPRIKEFYKGNDIKLCIAKKAPNSGTFCGDETKTCFFETQKCPDLGFYPKKKCTCSGSRSMNGKWTCTSVKCPKVPRKTSRPTSAPTRTTKGIFVSSPGRAFKVKMNLLSPKVLEGYDNVKDLRADLYQVVRFYVNSLIEQQATYYFWSRPVAKENIPSPSAEGATDFETNNQERGVDESDLVKSDGKFVYAAYGDMVVIWNAATGKLVANYFLPPIYDFVPTSAPIFSSSSAKKPGIVPPISYNPKPSILGMSLAEQRLVLYVQGYGEKLRSEKNYTSVFWNDDDTRIVFLDTSRLPNQINIVTQEDIQGTFVSGCSIGANLHVVTTSYIEFYPLASALSRWNENFLGMNETQYKVAATKIAIPLIDKFVSSFLDSILDEGVVPSMPKISLWQSDLGGNENIAENIFSGGAIQAYMQLTSFSVKGLNGKISLSKAGVFTPSSWGYTYAVEGNLVFAAQGWNWRPWLRGSSQTTYLLGFKLEGASATPAYLGSVDGYILNQYSLSIYDGHLRIATTIDTFWPLWEPLTDGESGLFMPQPESRTNNSVHVLKIPTGTETAFKSVTSLPNLGKPNERFTSFRCFKQTCYAGKQEGKNHVILKQ
jgi:hypothetical protein